ncbi:MAG: pyridoxal 5'-phosphate synthase glutaminase subunit PdxT [Lachnospiraceae bacterium]|nr:pyridoxal 5'-phosphate synthase glutaminase subunit PdxT [Lachnospiraceae bacterium]
MKIAVLALQGAFIEHEHILEKLGAEVLEIRNLTDLEQPFDALVLPGGESTVMGRLLREEQLLEPLREKIQAGMPVLATCAGLILLAAHSSNDDRVYFGTMPVTVKRNAYGRQLGSFETSGMIAHVGNFPMRFIRAPYIEETGEGVEVLATVEGKVVAARYGNQLGLAFHPELTQDTGVHAYFLRIISDANAIG